MLLCCLPSEKGIDGLILTVCTSMKTMSKAAFFMQSLAYGHNSILPQPLEEDVCSDNQTDILVRLTKHHTT